MSEDSPQSASGDTVVLRFALVEFGESSALMPDTLLAKVLMKLGSLEPLQVELVHQLLVLQPLFR
jgi:hypothetical protein